MAASAGIAHPSIVRHGATGGDGGGGEGGAGGGGDASGGGLFGGRYAAILTSTNDGDVPCVRDARWSAYLGAYLGVYLGVYLGTAQRAIWSARLSSVTVAGLPSTVKEASTCARAVVS